MARIVTVARTTEEVRIPVPTPVVTQALATTPVETLEVTVVAMVMRT
jgi:hypothetical protein